MNCIYNLMIKLMILCLLAFGLTADSAAQRRGSFDAESYFKSLDRNGDEKLDKNELHSKALAFLKRRGVDVEGDSIPLSSISKQLKPKNKPDDGNRGQKAQKTKNLKVPSFGVPAEKYSVTPFGVDGAEKQEEFSESTLKNTRKLLGWYDRDKNGVLDETEIKRARWGAPTPSESDLNQDGVLSRYELNKRYHLREQEQNKQSESTQSRSSRSRRRGNGTDSNGRSSNSSSGESSSRSSSRSSSSSSSRSRGSGRTSPTTSSSTTSSSTSASRSSAAYEKYAKNLIKQYDKDKDSRLSKAEWKARLILHADADQNKDGYVTEEEYADALQADNDKKKSTSSYSRNIPTRATASPRTSTGSRARSASRSKYSSNGKSSRKSGAGDFSKLDKDSDNQVQMHEYSSDWDDKKVKEYYAYDTNRDGVITSAEWKAK